MAKRSFVGFGFGPIQSGLMLYEAMKSSNFDRYTIAEVDQKLVDDVRANGNAITINIAHADKITAEVLSGFWIGNPNNPDDRKRIASEISQADEMATAIPSVNIYTAGGGSSIASLLASSINPDKPQILYASENNNYAAHILVDEIRKRAQPDILNSFQALDTVIGKMSGVVQSAHDIKMLGLTPMTPGSQKAVLVESFNRIYVSKITVPIRCSIEVFEEKEDLIPFEEAKLFGHNAIHSLLGYMAFTRGYRVMSEIRNDQDLMNLGRRAFIDESGAALIGKYSQTGDPLFTPQGFQAYADDLIERMTNPFLHDEVARICRDPHRKLGYNDRIIGTMRQALSRGIKPSLMALGAVAGLRFLADQEQLAVQKGPGPLDATFIREQFRALWQHDKPDEFQEQCLDLILEANSGSENR